MKQPAEVFYLAILVFIGSVIGFICRFNNLSDYALMGLYFPTLVVACIFLYKNRPQWIPSAFEDLGDNDDRIYKLEASRKWKTNTNIRALFMILSWFFSYALGHLLWEYIESMNLEEAFGDKLVLAVIIITTVLLIICITGFLKKENELYTKNLWSKFYILEKYEERKLREEFMDGSYLD